MISDSVKSSIWMVKFIVRSEECNEDKEKKKEHGMRGLSTPAGVQYSRMC